ncbi:hypothetical protein Celaphus_00002344, partial [Cervus elaphus hippelaphus]
MWCVPHPSKSDNTLVLLDTEGLGDVEKVAMASGQDMMAPISLVENDNAQLSVNQEAIETLEKISQPV